MWDKRQENRRGSFRYHVWRHFVSCAMFSCLMAVLLTLVFGRTSVHSDLTRDEQALADYVSRMAASGSVSAEELTGFAARHGLRVTILPAGQAEGAVPAALAVGESITASGGFDLPVTYLRLNSGILVIRSSVGAVDYVAASFLPLFTFIALMLVSFLLLSLLTSRHVSRPVRDLSEASRRVEDGDLTVSLDEGVRGELGTVMHVFNGLTGRLSQTDRREAEFLAGASHELRTPVASIRGYAAMLQMDGLTGEQQQAFAQHIAAETDRLSRLTDTMLQLSRLENAAPMPPAAPFRFDEELRLCVLELEPLWDARGILPDLELEEVTVTASRELLRPVWRNLLLNAIQYSPDGAAIEVGLTASGDTAVAVFRDHGIGMPPEVLPHIFERFYQADPSRSADGAGLGLCVARAALERAGGTIDAASAPGAGSTFTVRLPLVPAGRAGTSA